MFVLNIKHAKSSVDIAIFVINKIERNPIKVIALFFPSILFFSAFSGSKNLGINYSASLSPCGKFISVPTLQKNGIRILTCDSKEFVQKELAQIELEFGTIQTFRITYGQKDMYAGHIYIIRGIEQFCCS